MIVSWYCGWEEFWRASSPPHKLWQDNEMLLLQQTRKKQNINTIITWSFYLHNGEDQFQGSIPMVALGKLTSRVVKIFINRYVSQCVNVFIDKNRKEINKKKKEKRKHCYCLYIHKKTTEKMLTIVKNLEPGNGGEWFCEMIWIIKKKKKNNKKKSMHTILSRDTRHLRNLRRSFYSTCSTTY